MKPWEDESSPVAQRAAALLDAATTRGRQKTLGLWLDRAPQVVRTAVVAEAVRRGNTVDPSWPSKKLLRIGQGRQAESRERRTPIARDESFACAHCGRAVPKHGRTARNHCPYCLRSLHVDHTPGDRANDCHGILDPVGVESKDGVYRLRFRCRRCGFEGHNQVLLDGDPPDDWSLVTRVAAGEAIP